MIEEQGLARSAANRKTVVKIEDLLDATIAEVGESIRIMALSPVDVTRFCLDQIAALNPKFNAFITVLEDTALAEAKTAEREVQSGGWRGPLHGVPVAIKDLYDTAGVKTTAAFKPFKHRTPSKDAVAVARLKQAGAIVVGKTNMHRLAMGTTSVESAFGAVHNPWRASHIAGGSSGGSAAAVAVRMCFATLDTDAIGSCRLPAACCGVSGFKGSYDLVAMQGILEGEKVEAAILMLSQAGLMARSVADVAAMLDIVAKPGSAKNYTAELQTKGAIRIGNVTTASSDREVARTFSVALETLRTLGAVNDVDVKLETPGFDISHIEEDRRSVVKRLFDGLDVLVLPTTDSAPPKIKDVEGDPTALSPANTMFANYYGLPAISIPCGFAENGLPLGLQIVGQPGEDSTVLAVAHAYETATDWSLRHP